ncbi:hypothetical protein BC831DRAFT_118927 [Entophlyctis helioformis]|nr:hypothetical protein BC831DRAFT_118927 [Entophlyctis helioformis]
MNRSSGVATQASRFTASIHSHAELDDVFETRPTVSTTTKRFVRSKHCPQDHQDSITTKDIQRRQPASRGNQSASNKTPDERPTSHRHRPACSHCCCQALTCCRCPRSRPIRADQSRLIANHSAVIQF